MAKKGRSAQGYRPRRVDVREIRQRFLIVCEGEKTEPLYFQGFRGLHVVVRVEGGAGDPQQLVAHAAGLWARARADFDQVWCVFDRDDVPAERFNRALAEARQQDIHVAYSNQAFELWYLLHFQECSGALTRRDYVDRLGRHLRRPYEKNDPRLFAELEPWHAKADTRAARLITNYDPPTPSNDDPSTTVHLLVRELRRFARP